MVSEVYNGDFDLYLSLYLEAMTWMLKRLYWQTNGSSTEISFPAFHLCQGIQPRSAHPRLPDINIDNLFIYLERFSEKCTNNKSIIGNLLTSIITISASVFHSLYIS